MAKSRAATAPDRRPSSASPAGPAPTDPSWVAALTGRSQQEAARWVEEARSDREFAAAIERAHVACGRPFYAQIRAPFELYALVRILRPRHIVEVGVSSGVSSSYFLRALQKNGAGILHSIDLPTPQKGPVFSEKEDSPVALPPGKSSGWAVPASVRHGWDLRIGPSQKMLPSLVGELDRVDIFLHDSLHTFDHATFEFSTVDPKVPSGGIFLADNTEWLEGALDRYAEGKHTKTVYRNGIDLGGFAKP